MTDRPTFNPGAQASGRVVVAPTVPDTLQFNPANLNAQFQAKQQQVVDLRTAPLGPVGAWSMSRLFDFESCPHAVYLSKVEKMPTPSGPAAERGTQVHDHIEGYIEGRHSDVIKEMHHFIKLIDLLRDEYAAARCEVEGDWAFTRQWDVTSWGSPDAWGRFKLDALWHESETSATVIDWKTGRKFGNELKHNQQGMGYAIAAFLRYPELEYVSVKFAYLDKNDELKGGYTRQQAELLRPGLTERADRMTTCTDFEPKPSFHACRWCAHGKVQEGYSEPACKFAHEQVTH
jgi:hypothetical protein